MIDSAALHAFRNTLALVPVDWVLWALDANAYYVFLEGPGLVRMGVNPADRLHRPVDEAHPDNATLVALVHEAMRGPITGQVVISGHTLLISGEPALNGGCMGLAMVVKEEEGGTSQPRPPAVLELKSAVPAIGAEQGNLLVVDPRRPGSVGLYREIDLGLLPVALAEEVIRLSSPASPVAPRRALARRSAATRPAPASHLRLLP